MHRLMVFGISLAGAAVALADGGDKAATNPQLKMETTLGDIMLELDAEKAPISVQNFLRYAEDGYYDGTVFHRVIPTFMIQGGGFTADMEQKADGLRPPIKNEWRNGLKNVRGSISMARTSAPDSATSQFFINVVDNASLDAPRGGAAYAVFGRVVEGMETVDKIRETETATHPKYGGGRDTVVPVTPVVIKSVKLVNAFDIEKLDATVTAAMAAAKEAEAEAAAERERAMAEQTKLAEKNKMEQRQLAAEAVKKAEVELNAKSTTTDSGLVYIDIVVGEGESPSPTSNVEVHYTGWLLDGTKFDSSVDRAKPAKFPLNRVIKGWTEGVGSMKVGGKRKLFIPSDLGYGDRGSPPRIPPGATLVFDVELLSMQ